ncbi:adenylate/guanylate cyclase domain-containing protein [Mycobacterium marinum]|uniref:adenylate/guanylate cyclase domain-containing protein n=5 Tax=Mycobacterium marinum TaxID=1781 RepID=UPI0035685F89
MDRLLNVTTDKGGQPVVAGAYGSRLLGEAGVLPERRWVRIRTMSAVAILGINLIGIGVMLVLLTLAVPEPNMLSEAPAWLNLGVGPAYNAIALVVGTWWIISLAKRALRWYIEGRRPSRAEATNTFRIPSRVAAVNFFLWGLGTLTMTSLYGLVDTRFVAKYLFSVSFCGVLVATGSYLLTEFWLRPMTAQALETGPPTRRIVSGIIGRTIVVWLLGSGVPLIGISLFAVFEIALLHLTEVEFAVGVLIASSATLVFGLLLIAISAWLTATPVRVVRAALKRVERGDLQADVVVFDGSELGELQSGFNSMVEGLRERERVRDLFGRHVGREVAAAAERKPPQLGGEERYVAVVFVDIIGSTQLVSNRPATDVVQLLNRFFAVIVDEVERHRGLVNKFEGDASLAIFGAPNPLECPEVAALSAARAIAGRLCTEVPECRAGIGVAAGQVVAGNVGANERFEYTVIGGPVNEAARLCELAKSYSARLVASSETVAGATETERAHWNLAETVTLRGRDRPTRLAIPATNGPPPSSPARIGSST